MGINLFDTADDYGQGWSERILGEALRGRSDDIVVVTKFGEDPMPELEDPLRLDADIVRDKCETSLERLGTECIDVYLLHRRDYPLERAPEMMGILEDLVRAGKIRYYGWSTDDVERARLFAGGEHCTAIEHRLNVINDNEDMLRLCQEQDLASLNRVPLLMGVLTGRWTPETKLAEEDPRAAWFKDEGFQMLLRCVEDIRPAMTSGGRSYTQGALGWIWARSPLAIPLPGFRDMGQLEALVGAMGLGPLDGEAREVEEGGISGLGVMNMKIKIIRVAAVMLLVAGCQVQPTGEVSLASPTVTSQAEVPPTSTPTLPTVTPPSTPEQPTPTLATPSPTATLAPLNMQSDIDTIRERLLHSHESWQSLWVQFSAFKFPPQGSDEYIQLARIQIWMRQPGEVLLLCGFLADADPDYIFISDGEHTLEAEFRTGFQQEGEVMLNPLGIFFPQVENPDESFDCPPKGMVTDLVREMIFPMEIARREGSYTLVSEDTVARRAALVVEFRAQPDDLIFDRYWIDVQTGMVLEHHVIDMTGESLWVVSEISVFPLVINPQYPADFFKLEIPEEVKFQEAPE